LESLFRGEVLAFRDRYPRSGDVRVVANGSAVGMEQLVNGEVAMSVLTRELTDPEVQAAVQRQGLSAFPIAWDGVAVIVHRSCPVEQISRTELGLIYRGEQTQWRPLGWKGGGTILALTTDPKLGMYGYVQQALMDGGAYGSQVVAPPSERDVVDIVATRPNAIACVSRASVDDRVKAIQVSQALGLPYVALTEENLILKRYPLIRSVSVCTVASPPATASEFITFASSVEGQRIVARHGYGPATVPVKVVRTAEEEH
jgi:phosphate transport system substrate-binding protein